MMAVFRVQVNYVLGTTGKWSNVWHVRAANMADASAAPVIGMEDHLLALLSTTAVLKSYLVSEEGTSSFATIDRNSAGLNGDTGSLLPLYNSLKAIFPSLDFGRPDIKYFKGLVGENFQTAGVLESSILSAADTEITAMITDMAANDTPLVTDNDQDYSNVTIQSAVQMRQMHRKRRKTVVTP